MDSILISKKTLLEARKRFEDNKTNAEEEELIKGVLEKEEYKKNIDKDIVAMKVALIDVANSTHLSQYRSKIPLNEIVSIIMDADLKFDKRVCEGDPTLVSDMAKACKGYNDNKGVNLFSFSSKYCCYHNRFAYGGDAYSIYDSKMKKYLPLCYREDSKEWKDKEISTYVNGFNYKGYNDDIGKLLEGVVLDGQKPRQCLDHMLYMKEDR